MYEFKYQVTEKEYLDYNIYHMNTSPDMKKRFLFYRLMVPLFLVLWAVVTYDPARNLTIQILFVLGFSVLWFFLVKPLLIWSVTRRISRMGKTGKLRFEQENTVRFADDEMVTIVEEQEIKAAYAALERIAVYGTTMYIHGREAVYLLPLSVFASGAEQDAFTQFLQGKIDESKLTEEAEAE